MTLYCRHDDCKCHALEELMFLGLRIGMKRQACAAAVRMMRASGRRLMVRCRHVPRPGPVPAPFPGEAA